MGKVQWDQITQHQLHLSLQCVPNTAKSLVESSHFHHEFYGSD
jgi:hypothetical protein